METLTWALKINEHCVNLKYLIWSIRRKKKLIWLVVGVFRLGNILWSYQDSTCNSVHSWRLYIAAPLWDHAASTMTRYPNTEQTSPYPMRVMLRISIRIVILAIIPYTSMCYWLHMTLMPFNIANKNVEILQLTPVCTLRVPHNYQHFHITQYSLFWNNVDVKWLLLEQLPECHLLLVLVLCVLVFIYSNFINRPPP